MDLQLITVERKNFSSMFRSVRISRLRTAQLAIFTGVSTTLFASYKYGKHSVLIKPPQDSFPLSSITKLDEISSPIYCTDKQLASAIERIKTEIGAEKVHNSSVELNNHTRNEFTPHEPLPHEVPRWVAYPSSTEDVSQIMKSCFEFNVPVVPFSGGTSLEGHFFSTRPGLVVDTSKMNKILEVHHDDLDAVVQAGVNWQDLNTHLEPSGLMLGTDCGPNGLISGMINTNASGINALRYGAMVANVISITVVLSDGTVVKTKKRPRKSSAGYNLTGLFIGSEGTLGIVTEATVKLHVKPKYTTVVVGQFPTILDSTNTVAQLFRAGVQPEAVEFLDTNMMHCLNYSGYYTREWLECPTIFFKVGGLNKVVVDEHLKELKAIAHANNCSDFILAKNKEEGEELFSARKNAFYSMIEYGKSEIDEDIRIWVTDIAVPLSNLSTVLGKINDLFESTNFFSIILAHAADGNFHADLFYKIEDKLKCEKVINKMVEIGLEYEGTCTGEHGVGNAKRNFLQLELGDDAIGLMRKVKFALDPKRLMNPDKIFKIDPEDGGEY